MFVKAASLFSPLFVGLSMLLGPVQGPHTEGTLQQAPVVQPVETRLQTEPQGPKQWPFTGDRIVREGLILAVISASGLQPAEVWGALDEGSSIADVATSAGKTEEDVLVIFDESIQYVMDRRVGKGRLPESLAQGRVDWFKEAARQMIRQPGFSPAYPGLHELHGMAIRAAAQTSELSRQQVREELRACRTLNELLEEAGHSGAEAVEAAMGPVRGWLDGLVQEGKLAEAQRQSWESGIQNALMRMMDAHGLHVAGKACSH